MIWWRPNFKAPAAWHGRQAAADIITEWTPGLYQEKVSPGGLPPQTLFAPRHVWVHICFLQLAGPASTKKEHGSISTTL